MSLPLEQAISLEDAPMPRPSPLLRTAWRYALSTSGPVATSGAHFLASLIFVRFLPAAQFGMFSFVLIIVPFCMSLMGASAVVAVTLGLNDSAAARTKTIATCMKLNLLLSAATALAVFTLLLIVQSQPLPAMLLGLFGGFLNARWFGRCFAFVQGQVHRAVASDLAYALALTGGLCVLALTGHVTFLAGAALLMASALLALLPLGRAFLRRQVAAVFEGHIRDYRPIFRDMTRWSLLGVVLTEVTVNAHAYLVTFFAGPEAFALLALGMLLMRPVSLIQSALPDMERPVMLRAIAAGDLARLSRTTREFLGALLAVWLGTALLAAGLLAWFPHLLLKKGYALDDLVLVTVLTATIMMVRNFRSPPGVLLQAAGQFKPLAGIGTKSCIVSVTATLALLLAFGPVLSLLGIIAGELVMMFETRRLARKWMLHHG